MGKLFRRLFGRTNREESLSQTIATYVRTGGPFEELEVYAGDVMTDLFATIVKNGGDLDTVIERAWKDFEFENGPRPVYV
ncbi:hypothetical protein ABZ916_25850 [Streptomyces sp. NPDC046853]|uniref:hypothetical protein n=1 Tax=Streptomyces sp. NPDC046853 TaxID=3154920 RepID=UPI0033C02C7B